MARRRMIDPHFWVSRDIGKLTCRQRLLAIGLFSIADDEGRGIAHPAYIRSQLFPYDEDTITSRDIQEDLRALEKHLSLVVYTVDGEQYYAWKNWQKWQTINRPQGSLLPPPPEPGSAPENDAGGEGGETGLPELTATEREILRELKAIPHYSFDYEKDRDYIRNLAVEFPTLDLLAEAKKYRTYKFDKPLQPKSNARLQFRNWCEKAARWQQEKRVTTGGQHSQPSQPPAEADGEAKIDLDRFLWKDA